VLNFLWVFIVNIDLGNFILQASIQASISIGGAFLAAHIAMKKFRGEKCWEKKALAYTELIGALHSMKWRAGELQDAEQRNKDFTDEEYNRMWEEFEVARKEIGRIADYSTFLISDEVVDAIREMEHSRDIRRDRGTPESRFEDLLEEYTSVDKCLERIKEIGRADLGINKKKLGKYCRVRIVYL
jgi:hypothetical protein